MLSLMGYWEIEKAFENNQINREVADEAHKQHKIISEAIKEREASSQKMIKAMRICDDLKLIKDKE